MNRLTDRNKEIPLPCADNGVFWARVHEKLARYEDTGLEPEKMRELLHDSTGPLHKKLGEWIDAEQEGRLLVLPCRVGDTVWAFWYLPTSSRYVIYCAEVKEFRLREKHFGRDISVLLEPVDFRGRRKEYGEDDFGKTVFLTREDAEKALEGMKNDEC